MNGSTGMRGYLLQTMSCLLDSFDTAFDWQSVAIEPVDSSEKVDILWRSSAGLRVTQVKSSQNQISKAMMEAWAAELQGSVMAEEYELLLIGPCAQSVASAGKSGKVRVPTPRVLDITSLVEQAAHRLDKYLQGKGIQPVPPFARELLVHGLVSKLATYSTSGTEVARSDLDRLLLDWINVLYPQVIGSALSMQCDLLVDTVILARPTLPSKDHIPLVLPFTLVNGGARTAVVEWIAVKVVCVDHTKMYTPISLVDMQKFIVGRRALGAENSLGAFSEFPVLPGQAATLAVLFSQDERNLRYPYRPWTVGHHTLEVFVKYSDRKEPQRQKTLAIDVSDNLLRSFHGGDSIVMSIRNIDI